MRKFKFRMWACEAEQMCDWESLLREDEICCEKNQGPTIGQCLGGYTDDVEVMQFTGITDNKRIEIYEGDIVRIWVDNGFDVLTQCEYLGDSFYLNEIHIDPTYDHGIKRKFCVNFGGSVSHVEVVGNIFENPELLEKVK